jgi:hypothetical protein
MNRPCPASAQPVVSQPAVNGFRHGLPDRRFLQMQRSHRHEDLNPQARHRQRRIGLDHSQQGQHFRLVGNIA